MFCCAPLYVLSSVAIISMGKRELVALLSLSSSCLVIVVWLQFVIVIFPDHTHYFGMSFMWTAIALASLHIWISFEPSSLNLNLMCWLKCLFYNIYASIRGRLWRVCTFAWSSLSLGHSSKISCGSSNGNWMPFCASSEGSGTKCIFAQAYFSLHHYTKSHLQLTKMAICVLFTPAASTLLSLHICAGIFTEP